MKNFDEWCESNGIDKSYLRGKQLSMAFQIWGNWCYQEGKKLETANEELKTRIKRAEKATYLASKDEVEANYNIKTMSEDDLSDEIEKYMFHLYCRADDEILKEIQGEEK